LASGKNLKELIADEDERAPIPVVAFKASLSQKKVEALKKARATAKDDERGLTPDEYDAIPGIAEIKKNKELAKHQIFKWSLSVYMSHKSIALLTDEGIGLRKGLSGLWDLNKTYPDFLGYLTEPEAKKIADTLALDSKKKVPIKAAAKGTKVQPAGSKAPTTKRRKTGDA
jgi:hypothetical protein